MQSSSLQELEQIPGAGYNIARDMPHAVERSEIPTCRGMLYVFRCAIYYASNTEHNPELLKWENWKDKE